MKIAKRIFLFASVNLLVIATISIVLNVLGVRPYLDQQGINYTALMVFCLIWGFGGAFISLGLSRIMAKWMMGVKVIDPSTATGEYRRLVETVHEMASRSGITKMPEVGVYESPEVNAFATGPTKNRSLVAVSTGLLRNMNQNEVEGVLAHEVAHISNGDMVTMTLVQGVVNAFVMFIARVIAFFVSGLVRDDGARAMVHIITVIVLDILLSFLGMIVVAWFSRLREYRADEGGAQLSTRANMVAALSALKRMYEPSMAAAEASGSNKPAFQNLKISGKSKGLMKFFASHPPLDERIRRLQEAA
jgi:heat shock protein HtpX